MATQIKIEWDSRALTRALDNMTQRQMPFAIALALTRTAQKIKGSEIEEMHRVLDRPTPFTLNSLYIRPATKTKQEAEVFFKDFAPKGTPAAKYLMPQVVGGPRSNKRLEGALRRRGFLHDNEFLIPGEAAPLNAYGNISAGFATKILSAIGANPDPLSNSRRGKSYFFGAIGDIDGLPTRGIWERRRARGGRSSVRPVFIATTKAPTYKPRFHFFEVAERVQGQNYAAEFARALDEAIAKARR